MTISTLFRSTGTWMVERRAMRAEIKRQRPAIIAGALDYAVDPTEFAEARDLAQTVVSILCRTAQSAYVLDGSLSAVNQVFESDRALARELASALEHGSEVAHKLISNITEGSGRDGAQVIAHAFGLAGDLAHVVARTTTPDLGSARRSARELFEYLASAIDRMDALLEIVERGASYRDTDKPDQPGAQRLRWRRDRTRQSQIALRLTRLATRCLPARHRARYQEECAAELGELATSSRWAQWHYALNFLISIWMLRLELGRANRTPAPDRRLR